ncbi:MAG TPA: cytochrome ubiquinol oxidase subunit I [Burkholderiaceae bacterium]|nr:cytochrome ubiquinol oxidase subunit I [Burkholderiaceae bacterium]
MAAGLTPQWLRHADLQALRWHARCRHRLYRLVLPPWPWLLALAALLLPLAGFAQGVAPAHDPMPMTSLLWSLRAMVGSWVVLLGVVCVLVWRGPAVQTTRGRFALWACVLTLPLPWIAMISGWLVLELGQPAPPSTAVVAAQAATEATAAGNNAPPPSSPAALLGWGCAYALLMFINLKLSLRWLRLEPLQGSVQAGAVTARPSSSARSGGGGFTERLAQRYRPGVGESEFDMVVEEHSRPAANSSGPMPLMLTDESSGRTFDVDQLRRAIARLRKERNALRKVVKAKQQKRSEHGAHVVAQRAAPAPSPAPVRARGRPGGEGDMREIPVLNDVVQTPATRR